MIKATILFLIALLLSGCINVTEQTEAPLMLDAKAVYLLPENETYLAEQFVHEGVELVTDVELVDRFDALDVLYIHPDSFEAVTPDLPTLFADEVMLVLLNSPLSDLTQAVGAKNVGFADLPSSTLQDESLVTFAAIHQTADKSSRWTFHDFAQQRGFPQLLNQIEINLRSIKQYADIIFLVPTDTTLIQEPLRPDTIGATALLRNAGVTLNATDSWTEAVALIEGEYGRSLLIHSAALPMVDQAELQTLFDEQQIPVGAVGIPGLELAEMLGDRGLYTTVWSEESDYTTPNFYYIFSKSSATSGGATTNSLLAADGYSSLFSSFKAHLLN